MRDFFDFIFEDVLPFLILLLVITTPLFIGINHYEAWKCENFSEVTGRDTKCIDYDACFVKQNDEWIRYDNKYKQ